MTVTMNTVFLDVMQFTLISANISIEFTAFTPLGKIKSCKKNDEIIGTEGKKKHG